MIITETVADQNVDVMVIERHYTVAEAAELLRVSRPYIYDRIRNGTFTVVELGSGRHYQRIPASSLLAFIEGRTYRAKTSGRPSP